MDDIARFCTRYDGEEIPKHLLIDTSMMRLLDMVENALNPAINQRRLKGPAILKFANYNNQKIWLVANLA